jgi:hypothetical protein
MRGKGIPLSVWRCGLDAELRFLAKGKVMSGGFLLGKRDRSGLMFQKPWADDRQSGGLQGRSDAGSSVNGGGDWRVPMRPRVSLEGNVGDDEKEGMDGEGHRAVARTSGKGEWTGGPPPHLGLPRAQGSNLVERRFLSQPQEDDGGLRKVSQTLPSMGGLGSSKPRNGLPPGLGERDWNSISMPRNQPLDLSWSGTAGKSYPVASGQAAPMSAKAESAGGAPAVASAAAPIGPRPVIRQGKTATPQEAQEMRVWVLEDLKRNHPGFMQLHPDRRQKVYDEALTKVWSAEDQKRYDASAFKDEAANQALDAGDYQKLRVRAEELVKTAPGFGGLGGQERMDAIHNVALGLGKMTEKDFQRAMTQRGADERGFWATVGGSAWGTLGRTAGSAVKLGERAYALGDDTYDVSKGNGEKLKEWGDDFEAKSGDDQRTGARLTGNVIGSTAPYLLAAPGLGAAGLSTKAIQYALGGTGAALSANDAYDRGKAQGLEGKELLQYVAGHGGLGALMAMIGVKGAAPGSSVTGSLLSKALPQAAKGIESAAVKTLGQGGQRALAKIGGATADGVVLGAGANTGANVLEKTFIDPNVGVFDNTGTAALSGGLGGAMGGVTRVSQDAARSGLSNRYFGGGGPPKAGSPEAARLSPAARGAAHLLTERRGLAPVIGDAMKPGLQRGREALGNATRRGDEIIRNVRDDFETAINRMRGGDPEFALAGGEAPHGRTASGRPRVGLDGLTDDPNNLHMAGKGGNRSKSKPPRPVSDTNGVSGDTPDMGPGRWDGPPPFVAGVRPYDVAKKNPIPGSDQHHLDPDWGRNDPDYKTGPTIAVRNDNAGGKVDGGKNYHTAEGGVQTSLEAHVQELGFTRKQWNALPQEQRLLHLRRYYAGLGIPFPK